MKWLLRIIIFIGILGGLFYFVGIPYLTKQTKKNSPETTAVFTEGGYDLEVRYSAPYKKDREIFGALVPYDVVWRTGANEPTTFRTGGDISLEGEKLAAGTYSLWTVPGPEKWTVHFNSEVPQWGLNFKGEASRAAESDVLVLEVQPEGLEGTVEQLQLDFMQLETTVDSTVVSVPYFFLAWDDVRVKMALDR